MRNRLILSAVLMLAVGTEALAEGMSYNYVQGGLLGSQVKAGGNSDGGAGYRLEGGISNNLPMFGFFNLSANKYPEGSDNLRFTNISAGVGGHLPLGSALDFVGGVSYESVRVKYTGFRATSYGGLGYAAGVRGQFGTQVEWTAGVKYRDIQQLKSILGFTVGGRYFLSPAMALGIDVSRQKYGRNLLDATESILALSFRYQFSDPW